MTLSTPMKIGGIVGLALGLVFSATGHIDADPAEVLVVGVAVIVVAYVISLVFE